MNLLEARVHNARVHAKAEVTQAEISLDELKIVSVCGNCFTMRPILTIDEAKRLQYVLVSPTGCLHQQSWDGGGDTRTACGVEAAATDWWWPL